MSRPRTFARLPSQPYAALWLVAAWALVWPAPSRAVVLWSDLRATLVHETGPGTDILGGALKRDDSATDTLYFKFHIDPLSDAGTELYSAAFQLFEGDQEHLALGNSLKAWGYSAFNTAETGQGNEIFGDKDLRSTRPDPSTTPGVFYQYELVHRGVECTIVFKVQYVAGGDDSVTVWLNPDLGPGATEEGQPEGLVTRFRANASFDQIRLRHGGGGGGWTFSDLAIATSFNDFVPGVASDVAGNTAGTGLGALSFSFHFWQQEQGLPQNSVHALTQTRSGYLWVGTDDGLARFDGVRFVSFGLREGLRSASVRVLLPDSRGALWIGTLGGGLSRYEDGRFTSITIEDGLPADSITALAEDDEGRLWVGTEAGLVVWQNGRLQILSTGQAFNSKPIRCLHKDRQGTMWVGAEGAGVFQYRAGQCQPLADTSPEKLLQAPHCLLVDRASRIWVGAGDDFVLCKEEGQWRRYRIPHHLARPYVSALAEQTDGTVWAGSVSEGLFQFQGGKLTAINASSGLSDNLIESLFVDREGNLWVGTGSGLNRLRRSNLSVFGQNEGLGYGPVQGLAEIGPGVMWAGKPSDGLYRHEGRNFSRLTLADPGKNYLEINSLFMARDGTCWVAGAHGLLQVKDPKTPTPAPEPMALAGMRVISLAEARQGGVWAGTRDGQLWRFREARWEPLTNFAQAHAITAMVPDTNDSLWIGTEGGGLYRFKERVQAHLDKGNELLSGLIRTLYLDAAGTLWIGTAGGGLSRWRDGRLTTFTTREGLADNTVSQILEDDAGRLWLGGNRGLTCVSKHELEELASGKLNLLSPQVYGRADGMLSEECTGDFCPAGLKTKSGLLWFSTLKGVVAVNPHPLSADAPPPIVVLEETLVDGVPVASFRSSVSVNQSEGQNPDPPSVADALQIAPGKHRLDFFYTGLSLSAPERIRFRYQLEGLNPDWVNAGAQRTVSYGYLPPGNYRFRVSACNSDGRWNEAGATLALTVLPRFWQTWWVLAIGGIAVLASVGGAARFAEKRKLHHRLQHLEQERSLERERARIAQDLHDDLGSSLTRISLLSDLVKADKETPAQVETHASKISQSAAQTVRALEEIVWALRPGSDSLQSLVEYIAHVANELFEGDRTRCRLDLPHDLPARSLPPEIRHNIFLIVKEALTNALKHADAKEVRLQAKASERSLEILVQDDGRGFDPKAPPRPGRQHGLGNMQRRAEATGSKLNVESAPGKGTIVRLVVGFPAQ